MKPTLKQVIEWARGAGEILRQGYGQQHQIKHKTANDLATEIDHRSEEYLTGQIQKSFPDHSVLAEESGLYRRAAESVWIIDPLDGTLNYAHGIPFFCVSIAWMENQQLQLGVVYEPMRDECFAAERGKGAWLNDQPIRVSAVDRLIDGLLAAAFAHHEGPDMLNAIQQAADISMNSHGVRRPGAAALDLAYVASGRFDGFWGTHLHLWDVAAGALLVQEAGGKVSGMDGSPDFLQETVHILCSNPLLYPILFNKIQFPEEGKG